MWMSRLWLGCFTSLSRQGLHRKVQERSFVKQGVGLSGGLLSMFQPYGVDKSTPPIGERQSQGSPGRQLGVPQALLLGGLFVSIIW